MRELIKTPDDKQNHIYSRLETADGKLFMGLHPMIFGVRVRCGVVGDPSVILDWCCGDSEAIIATTYDMVRMYLSKGGDPWDLPPHSDPKPWYRDPRFIRDMNEVFNKLDGIVVEVEDG